jgi:hypothetical protein
LDSALGAVGSIDPEIDAAVFVRKALEKAQVDKDAQIQFTFMPWNGGGNPSVIIDRVIYPLTTGITCVLNFGTKMMYPDIG